MRGRVVAGVLAGLLLGACGSDADELTPVAAGQAMAGLAVIDTRTDHQPVTATAYVEAEDGQALDEGDGVRTDETGFAEIVYADGSLTRLDAATEFRVVALGGDVTVPEITVGLDVGRVWNRVNTVVGERGRFEVETAVGVAAVRGTAFTVACTLEPVCTFSTSEGIVEVTTLDGQVLQVGPGDSIAIGLAPGEGPAGPVGAGDGGTGGDGGSDGVGASDGSDAGTDGGTGGTGPNGGSAGSGGEAVRTVVLDGEATDGPEGPGTAGLAGWTERNRSRDLATERFTSEGESCSITVNGRNIDHATTPETAIEASIDETLRVDAVATGELDTYTVDLRFAGVNVRAAEAAVEPDADGDRTTFRGDVDVATYASLGVGLYEVRARTTGTTCEASAFVEVTGRNPLTTATGAVALLLVVGGAAGLVTAINSALGGGRATLDPTATAGLSGGSGTHQPPAPPTASSGLTSRITDLFTRGGRS